MKYGTMAVKRFDLITGISIVARVLYNLEQVYVVTTGSELLLISKSFLLDSNGTIPSGSTAGSSSSDRGL